MKNDRKLHGPALSVTWIDAEIPRDPSEVRRLDAERGNTSSGAARHLLLEEKAGTDCRANAAAMARNDRDDGRRSMIGATVRSDGEEPGAVLRMDMIERMTHAAAELIGGPQEWELERFHAHLRTLGFDFNKALIRYLSLFSELYEEHERRPIL